MKRKGYYLCSLLVMIFVFLSCRDEEQDCTQAMQDIQNQLKENDLLKSVSQEREQCVLLFESNKIISARVNPKCRCGCGKLENDLTFANGSTYVIPTLGTSIDNLILSSTVNPSGCNPLSASVVVKLPVLGRIKLIVHSKPGKHTPDVEYTFKDVGLKQNIPVLGLYPNYNNQITLIYTDLQGNERARSNLKLQTKTLESRRLPKEIRV